MDRDGVEVSLILPAYNEAEIIEGTIKTVVNELSSFLSEGSYEVIVAENGSTDKTEAIVSNIVASDNRIRYISAPEAGRGNALNQAIRAANGDVVAYIDVDLATEIGHLEELIESVRTEGFDIATGSRYLDRSVAERTPKRFTASKGFNFLSRLLLRSQIQDHQCGFKAFDREVALELTDGIKDEYWFWDTELLVKSRKRGCKIKEFPVNWTEKGDSKVDLVRDVFGMGSQLIRTWWELSIRPKISYRMSIVSGFAIVAAAVLLSAYYLDYSELFTSMRNADYRLVSLAALVYVVSLVVRGFRYQDILKELDYTESIWLLTGAVTISQTANFVVPARIGDAVRAYIIKARRRVPYTTGFASLTIERILDLAVITLIAGGSMAVIGSADVSRVLEAVGGATGPEQSAAATGIRLAGVVGLGSIIVVSIIITSSRLKLNLIPNLLRKVSSDTYVVYVEEKLTEFITDLQLIGRNWHTVGRLGGTTVVIWGIDILTGLIVLTSLGVELTATAIWVATLAIAVGTLSKVIPLTPGGIGLYEGVFTFIIVTLTPIGWAVALSAAILDHALKNATTVIAGVFAVLAFNISLFQVINEVDEVDNAATTEETEQTVND